MQMLTGAVAVWRTRSIANRHRSFLYCFVANGDAGLVEARQAAIEIGPVNDVFFFSSEIRCRIMFSTQNGTTAARATALSGATVKFANDLLHRREGIIS